MYSRYGGGIDREDDFSPASDRAETHAPAPLPRDESRRDEPAAEAGGGLFHGLGRLLGGSGGLFSGGGGKGLFGGKGLLGGLNVKNLDTGDILLILILLLLFMESDDDFDWLILIGLVFVLGI
ncbi:hypothetical protein LJC34_03115 [Oscillospiraceae bacterium OttesenSCG-928-G22]|nr:hypothetical protein [Oscillospiraceae bacterium OttesenSCG-928-G22]